MRRATHGLRPFPAAEVKRLKAPILIAALAALLALVAGGLAGCAREAARTAPGRSQQAAATRPAPTPRPPPTVFVVTEKEVPEVPYVATPPSVVDEMLSMAQVKAGDVVYDLGCGDGRVVVTAARDLGARGVGIDVDPKRISESEENARRAGVSGRVKFIKQDLFDADLSAATVVTLYLLPEVNLRLRPKLLRELRPGTRLVSHNYDMGDWRPDGVKEVHSPLGRHKLFYWVIPEKAGAKD